MCQYCYTDDKPDLSKDYSVEIVLFIVVLFFIVDQIFFGGAFIRGEPPKCILKF